ncbi:hypothetical protein HK104_007267 [Borealophlyctis nickersoniae]|nr:hypothetical protein HK104_007267 [Borealophlyctis nickersoniae]
MIPTAVIVSAREDEEQTVNVFDIYDVFRSEIYPTIRTQMPVYKAFFMSPLVQGWLDRKRGAGWRYDNKLRKAIREYERLTFLEESYDRERDRLLNRLSAYID